MKTPPSKPKLNVSKIWQDEYNLNIPTWYIFVLVIKGFTEQGTVSKPLVLYIQSKSTQRKTEWPHSSTLKLWIFQWTCCLMLRYKLGGKTKYTMHEFNLKPLLEYKIKSRENTDLWIWWDEVPKASNPCPLITNAVFPVFLSVQTSNS